MVLVWVGIFSPVASLKLGAWLHGASSFQFDAPVRHVISFQRKDSGVPLLGPILGVNFRSSGAQKRGPSYLKPHSSDSVFGGQKWTPFQNERGSFQDQKTGPKKVPRIPDFVGSFSGRI